MRRFDRLAFFLPLLGIPLLLLQLEETRQGVREGLRLCGELLIPSLFPFSVLANTGIRMDLAGKLEKGLRLPVSTVPWVLGLLGGFPLGAQSLAALYSRGAIGRQEAIRASRWCNNAGAAFLMGAVGGVLGDARLGLALFGIQILSSLCLILLFSPGKGGAVRSRRRSLQGADAPASALAGALGDSALAMLRLCGSVCFFLGLWRALEALLPVEAWPPVLRVLLQGSMELSAGTAALGTLPGNAAFVLAAGLCGWGGLCVHLQAADALCGAGLPLGPYLSGKLCQGLLSCLLALCLARFGPLTGSLLLFVPATIFLVLKKRRWKTPKPVV